MYRGFNITDLPSTFGSTQFYEIGKEKYKKTKGIVNKVLEAFVTADGTIDGTKLQENWLPQIESDVFISHSHNDERVAITLMGMLNTLGLNCFVDSCVWGSCDELLKIIDDKHCLDSSSNTYNYTARNFTTSHVHMMLSNAIFRMIDNSECIFFLNSPNSIKVNDVISKTLSPWLYAEISITQVIRKKKPERELIKSESRNFSEQRNIDERINVSYDVNLSHLTKLKINELSKWIDLFNDQEHILDTLYKTFPLPVNERFING